MAQETWQEAEYELGRRVPYVAERRSYRPGRAEELLAESLTAIVTNVSSPLYAVYESRQAEARARLPRDAADAPTLALALALDCGIWTADRDFFGCGVPVWNTETLIWFVRSQTEQGGLR